MTGISDGGPISPPCTRINAVVSVQFSQQQPPKTTVFDYGPPNNIWTMRHFYITHPQSTPISTRSAAHHKPHTGIGLTRVETCCKIASASMQSCVTLRTPSTLAALRAWNGSAEFTTAAAWNTTAVVAATDAYSSSLRPQRS